MIIANDGIGKYGKLIQEISNGFVVETDSGDHYKKLSTSIEPSRETIVNDFEIGDLVEVVTSEQHSSEGDAMCGIYIGSRYRVASKKGSSIYLDESPSRHMYARQLKNLTRPFNKPTNKKIMTTLIQAFNNIFTSEPQKSFLKAGIIDASSNLTPEGHDVFVAWLFRKADNQAAFKAEVVDPIIAQMDEAKK